MKHLLIFCFVMLGLLTGVSATQINFATAGDNSLIIGYSSAVQNKLAQSFQGNNENITNISFYYFNTLSPASNINITLRAQNGTNASNIPLRYALLNKSLVTGTTVGTANLVTVTLNSSMNVTLGTMYWIVFEREDGNFSTTNYISIVRNATTNSYINGSSYQFVSAGWTNSSALYDFRGYITTLDGGSITPSLNFTNISLVNNTYTGNPVININTSILNTSTNGNVNQTYYLYYNTGILHSFSQYATNTLNGSLNLTISGLPDQQPYKIFFYANNNETNVSSMNYTFTRDSANPTINNNILNEYNSYNVNFNSSCTDISLVYCNISINGQNVALNTTSFNFTTNGNHSYNITALDLAGNSVTTSGVVLVNPYQTFRFYDYLRLTNINDFYIDGVLYSSNYTFKTYNYGLGSWDFNFSKEGYVNQTFNFTLNDTSNYNQTNNVTAVTITIKAYDIDTLVQIPFNLTLNGGVIAQYYNQVNFSDYYNNTPQGDVNALIASIGYSSANYNINIGAYSALTLTAYLIPLNDSDLFQFTVLSQDTGAALASVLIEVQELINTSYITASSKLTGDNGKTYFYLDSNKEYKVIFSKDEYVTATAFTIPTVTTYTVKLTGDSTTFNYVNEISYSFKPSEYLLQNNETYNFIGFISGNSLTSSNFSIVLNNGTTIYTNSNVNPTGTTYNYSYTIPPAANFTQMTMTINYIIDGELFTVSKDYKVITLNEDSFIKTMQNFGESNTEESNLWKWFIVMIVTVLVLISGVFLGTAVPLLIIPLWVFFSFVGWVDFTFTAVISVVALIMFLGGRR